MTFAIAGVTGNTGKVVAEELLARGEKIRVIVRDAAKGAPWKARGAEVAVADVTDVPALAAALRGTDGAYLLLPPNETVAAFGEYQRTVARALAAAVAESGVPHVVLLSSIGAQHDAGNGPIAGVHVVEELLGKIAGTTLSSLRAAYFYDNIGPSLGGVKEAGVLRTFFPAKLAFPMVSTKDIGRLAAELLLDKPAKNRVVQIGTAHSHDEIARALSDVLAKPVKVEEGPLSAMKPTLESFGFSSERAGMYAEMTGGIIDQHVAFEAQYRRVESAEPLDRVLRTLLG